MVIAITCHSIFVLNQSYCHGNRKKTDSCRDKRALTNNDKKKCERKKNELVLMELSILDLLQRYKIFV